MNDQDDYSDSLNLNNQYLREPTLRLDSLKLIVSEGPEVENQLETESFSIDDDYHDYEETQQQESFPYKEMPKNNLSKDKEGFIDQLRFHRHEYQIPFSFDLDSPLFWQNLEGTKLVALASSKLYGGKTGLKLNIYDDRFCLMSSAEYKLDREIEIKQFQFSHDEQQLAIQVNSTEYYFCFFENGFENDLFVDKDLGQKSLAKMSLKKYKIKGLNEEISIQFRISSKNNFFLFVDSQIYKFKKTIQALQHQVLYQDLNLETIDLSIDFEAVNVNSKLLQFIKIDGPFAVGFDQEVKQFWAYNYDEEQFFNSKMKIEDQFFQELGDLQIEKIVVNPQFNDIEFAWYELLELISIDW